jgi:hypothetical protein
MTGTISDLSIEELFRLNMMITSEIVSRLWIVLLVGGVILYYWYKYLTRKP